MTDDIEYTPRGFAVYGKIEDSREGTLRVQESSEIDGPYIWLFYDADGRVYQHLGEQQIKEPYLDVPQAHELIRALQRFVGAPVDRPRHGTNMRRFCLIRTEDVTGVSGTGVVAEGVRFSDGIVCIRWRTALNSTTLYDDIETAQAIHGHQGTTQIVWIDE